MSSQHEIQQILSFWFDEIPGQPVSGSTLWWGKSEEVDRFVDRTFSEILQRLFDGEFSDWLNSPPGRLASIICLDQFPRHIYRDTPNAFAFDEQSRIRVKEGLALQQDQSLSASQRLFFYIPLMHSEQQEDQQLAVSLYQKLEAEVSGEDQVMVAASLRSAIQHHDIIARFGRFPHRNAILHRPSTDEELHFLKQPGSSF